MRFAKVWVIHAVWKKSSVLHPSRPHREKGHRARREKATRDVTCSSPCNLRTDAITPQAVIINPRSVWSY